MKIAIPTTDGILIASDYRLAREYFITDISLGEITAEEIRIIPQCDICDMRKVIQSQISDCDSLMLYNPNNVNPVVKDFPGKEVIFTHENIITNALFDFLSNTLKQESNTCCCP